ncbi:hypothetical protein [Streptomyces sp. Ru71]|uniref:hypothetical protein n=1 Tax=Streptomyces sp. Ru71 TaxID=2080746 RepID=UPI002156679E|nr:hypothetical protein [Streptomyces sp. Ru71]
MLDQGVLVVTVQNDTGDGRTELLEEIEDLIRGYQPLPVVIAVEDPDVGAAAIDMVLQAHRVCVRLGVLMSVITHSAPLRRMLQTRAERDGVRLVINARADIAIAAAAFAAAA